MPQFTAPDQQGANLGFLQPSNPQPDMTTAKAIGTIGDLAIKGVQVVATKDVKNSMEALQKEYMDTTQPTYTKEEIASVTEFSKQLDMMKQAEKQNKRTSEYRVRAEALLKEKTAAFPGLEAEFRSAASGVLGFDPVGTAASLRAQELADAEAEAKRRVQAIEHRAVNEYYIPLSELYTEKGQKMYDNFTAINNHIYLLELDAKEQALMHPKLPKASAEEMKFNTVNRAFENANALRNNNTTIAWGALNAQVSKTLGRQVDLRTQADATLLSQIPQEKRKEIVYALEEAKQKSMEASIRIRGYFDSSQWNDYWSTTTAPFDQAISALNSEKSLAEFKQENDLSNTLIAKGLNGTETGKTIGTLKLLGLDPTAMMNAKMQADTIKYVSDMLAADPEKGKYVIPAPATMNKADVDALNSAMNTWIKDEKARIASGQAANPAISNALLNWVESAAGGADKIKDYRVIGDTLYNLSSKENADYVKEVLSREPALADMFQRASISYAKKLSRTVSARISEQKVPALAGTRGAAAQSKKMAKISPIEVVMEGDKLVVKVNKEIGADRTTRGGTVLRRKESTQYVDQVDKINKSVEALSILFGVDKADIYSLVLSDSPMIKMPQQESSPAKGKDQGASIDVEQMKADLSSLSKEEFMNKYFNNSQQTSVA